MNDDLDTQIRFLGTADLTCAAIEELMGEYVDGELVPALHAKMTKHIRDCPPCQVFEDGYRKTIELAAELRDQPMPEDVKRRFREGLNKKLGLNLAMCF